MKILLYTFQNHRNLTFKILRSKSFDKYERYFISGIKGINRLINKFIRDKYKFVIGFGDFNKRAKRIRIETRLINKYGKKVIVRDASKYYKTTLILPVFPLTYQNDKTSNGPCNRSAFLLLHNARIHKIDSKIAFIHIPSSFNILKAESIILSWLKELNKA